MNLVQLANDLEYVPKDQLAQMSQDPNSSYPAYLVLSEIQRRTLNEKNYQAMQEQPTTTVAEEVVDEFMQPQLAENESQGLQVGAPQSATPLPDSNISAGLSGVPTAPMQMAASGGATGYANKGKTEYKEAADDYGKQLQEIFEKEGRYKKRYSDYEKGERFTYPLTPRDYVVSDEEYSRLKEGDYVMGEGALQEYRPFLMLLNALDGESGARYMPESEVKGLKAKLKASIMEDKLSQMGMASGGRTGYAEGNQTALEESFNNPYENMSAQAQGMTGAGMGMDALGDNLEAAIEQYGVPALKTLGIINDDNSVNYGTLALQALSLNPAMRLGRGALGIAGAGLSRFAPKTMSSLKGLPSKIKNRFTSPVSKVDESLITSGSIQTDRVFDAAKSGKTLLNTAQNLAIPALVAKSMLSNGEETVVKQELTEEQLKIQELERQLAERENLKGLAGATAEKDNTGNWRDLARLGAGIMSAKNVSDIGGTVTNILDAQDKRGLVGLQSKFTQAQTDQILATTKAMPLEQKLATLQSLGKLFEKISSGEIEVTEEQKASYALQYQILNDEVLKMQGIASSGSKFLTEAEQKIFNQAKAG
jgi:hypothetical protein